VQLRAHGEVVRADVTLDDGGLTARLHASARGVAAGQAIVAYQRDPAGDIVLGSATIETGSVSAGPVSAGLAAAGAAVSGA
jgi:tRNA-uridine 2-sulfurtransferase